LEGGLGEDGGEDVAVFETDHKKKMERGGRRRGREDKVVKVWRIVSV